MNDKRYTADISIWLAGENATGIAGDIADAIRDLCQDNGDSEVGLGSYDLLEVVPLSKFTPQDFTHAIYDICNRFDYNLWIGDYEGPYESKPGTIQVWLTESRVMDRDELCDWLVEF